MIEWTTEAVAKITILVMAVPLALTVVVLIISILTGVIAEKMGINPASETGQKIEAFSGSIFYIAFLCVGFVQLTFAVLMLTGIWALFRYLLNFF